MSVETLPPREHLRGAYDFELPSFLGGLSVTFGDEQPNAYRYVTGLLLSRRPPEITESALQKFLPTTTPEAVDVKFVLDKIHARLDNEATVNEYPLAAHILKNRDSKELFGSAYLPLHKGGCKKSFYSLNPLNEKDTPDQIPVSEREWTHKYTALREALRLPLGVVIEGPHRFHDGFEDTMLISLGLNGEPDPKERRVLAMLDGQEDLAITTPALASRLLHIVGAGTIKGLLHRPPEACSAKELRTKRLVQSAMNMLGVTNPDIYADARLMSVYGHGIRLRTGDQLPKVRLPRPGQY